MPACIPLPTLGLMPALTVHQPWCAALALGHKPVENRNWLTHKRCWIALHASARVDVDGMLHPLIRQAFPLLGPDRGIITPALWEVHGAVQAIAHLSGCHPAVTGCCAHEEWGAATGYHLVFEDPHLLAQPVRVRGHRKLWTVDLSGATLAT